MGYVLDGVEEELNASVCPEEQIDRLRLGVVQKSDELWERTSTALSAQLRLMNEVRELLQKFLILSLGQI